MRPRLDARLEALARAVAAADGRLEAEAVAAARRVLERAGRRQGVGLEVTVAALAGPTGAGKSSLFNALAGSELVTAGALRPTTSTATAAVWGDVPGALLDWLEVARRHVVDASASHDLVLLDLPDFDSVQAGHRLEADRLVEIVDLLVWVVDPQKYADAVLHDRYLRPLASHAGVMLVALNQADRLAPGDLAACRADLERLAAGVPVMTVSARTGEGVDALRGLLRERAAKRAAATERLAADARDAAGRLRELAGCDGDRASRPSRDAAAALVGVLGGAAGVPAVVDAVARAHRRRGALRTGWPVSAWVRHLRPDPLRRLRLGDGPSDDRTGLPGPTGVQRLQVESAIREFAAARAGGAPAPWPALVRSAATRQAGKLADRLDQAIAGADLRMTSPRWWGPIRWLQRALVAVAAAGALWLLALAALGYLRLDEAVPTPDVGPFPLPTLLLAGGVLAGLLAAALAGWANRAGARRRARRARRALDERIAAAADELVAAPAEAELAARAELCDRLAEAAG